jgi:hypothetical protein
MATRHQITCVNKSNRTDPHERITHVGGKNQDGTNWRITQEEAIQGIQGGKWQFYVAKGGHSVDVIVATSRFGNKYIKTENDGDQPDNLLSLPECQLQS